MAKIYLIYNIVNNKKYVGVTRGNVVQRFCQHIDSSYRNTSSLTQFHKELKQSGEEVFNIFKYKILEECEDNIRFNKEIEYIKKIKPEYNEDGKIYYLLNIQKQIVQDYIKGATITQIRTKYKCRHSFISQILKSNNIKIQKSRSTKGKKIYLFNQDGQVIKEWVNVGACSMDLGVDRGNIRQSCYKNTNNNLLYFSSEGYHFKYDQNMPKNMFEVQNLKTQEIMYFKTKEALTQYFEQLFPDKNIMFGQLVRNRKSVYGYKIKKLYEFRN